jgi:hypothetical protein
MKKIKITYYDNQRLGNYQIRCNRLNQLSDFQAYVIFVLESIDKNITEPDKLSEKENKRRRYVQESHIEHMMNDDRIELIKAFVWKKNN